MFWPPGAQKTSKSDELSAKIKVFAFSKGVQKRRSQKAPKRAPGAAQEVPRAAQEAPRRPQVGPKSRQERPKRRPRAARSAPEGPQESQEALRDAPWAHFGLILGGPGHHFKQLRRPFRSSRALRQTIENTLRNHWSKGLVLAWPAFGGRKRNHDEGFTFSSGQERLLCLRIQLASQTCFLIRRNSKTHGFYVVPCFPSLSSPTRGSPRLEITRKCCSKSLVIRSFETAAGQKRIRTMARWPGFGGACPTGDPATELQRSRAWPSRSVLACI